MKNLISLLSILFLLSSINTQAFVSNSDNINISLSSYFNTNNFATSELISDPPLFVDAGPVQIICNGQSVYLTALATGGALPYTYLWSNGSTNQSIVVNPGLPTTFTVTVTDAAFTTASDQVFVIVNQSPLVYIGANQNACVGDIITLQETLYGSYLWSNGATTTSIQVSTNGIYGLTITDSNGCVGSDEVQVTFHPPPGVDLGPNQTIPYGNSTVLDAGSGYSSYQWSNGSYFQTITVSSSGTYSVTVTDPFGCVGSDIIYIEISAISFTVDAGNNQNICANDYATITATPLNGTPPYTYLWSSGHNTQVIIVSPPVTTTYTVTVTDANSTIAVDNIIITIDPSPNLNLGNDISSCEGDIVSLNSNTSGTFLWSTGEGTNNIQVTTTGIYSLTVTNTIGCSSIDEILVTFNSLPNINLGPNITINPGDSVILDAGSGYSAYLWSNGSMSQSIIASISGIYVVSVTDSNGCGNSSSISVTVTNPNNPGWTYTTTNTNHSILIPNYANITINGSPIEIGDFIGVFFDSSGTLSCSGYIEWNGMINGLAAWGVDSGYHGFVNGEEFKWKIWQASTGNEFEASATYITGSTFPNEQYFTINGTSGIESLTAPLTQGQIINLPFGWSIFSTYIIPTDPNLETVLLPIISDVQLVKNGDGQVYWPAYFLNLIGNMVIGDGYQIKLAGTQTLDISGTTVVPELNPISVPAGWSIIGYLRQTPSPIAEIFLTFVSDVELVKNGAGQVYWPAWGLNLIGYMNPGEGYQVKLSNANTLTYPPNNIPL